MKTTVLLKAVADETRFSLVTILLKQSLCVGGLSQRLGISEAAVSQHLKVLREAGFLSCERRGRFLHYHVNRAVLRQLADRLNSLAEVNDGCKKANTANQHDGHVGCPAETVRLCHGKKSDIDCACHSGHKGGKRS